MSYNTEQKKYDRIAYIFQGGGALGAYQVGAYKALEEEGLVPDWIAGVSIGSINAAIIAGNKPEDRVDKLIEFWDTIASPDYHLVFHRDHYLRYLHNILFATQALVCGQNGFFTPNIINPWYLWNSTPNKLSFYDTSPLRSTLEKLIDFDRINAKEMRLSLGTVEVLSGKPIYFSNLTDTIGAEHIMASAALPPGFPAVEINGKLYWDGGVLCNSPLEEIANGYPRVNTLCFMVDLFSRSGPVPRTLDDILERQKDIGYASHSKQVLDIVSERQELQHAISTLLNKLPASLQNDPEVQNIKKYNNTRSVEIIHIVYNSKKHELSSKDYNFSKTTLNEHLHDGYYDTQAILAQKPWEKTPYNHIGALLHSAPNNPFYGEFYD